MSSSDSPWSKQTRDYWFYGFLAVSSVSIAYLFSPFVFVLLFAGVTCVVTWPLYEYLLEKSGGRSFIAAFMALVTLGTVVFVPFLLVGQLFLIEAIDVVGRWVKFFSSGGFERAITDVQGVIAGYETPRVKGFLEDFVPAEFDLLTSVLGPIKDAVLLVLNTAGSLVPTLINIIATGAIDALIFLAAIVTFYMEGPRLLQVFANLSPMDDSYEGRLFDVFKEFATNLVLGSLATAVLQGIVASIGYLIVGVDGVIFFGLMTALFSFVPVVGTVLVWLPLSLAVGIDSGWMWGGFLIGWSVVFTGTVDNLVKPLFLRGSSNIHPLLIFLAVFGGLAWMHLPGILVGPVLVAFFLSLYTIYCEDYLGISNEIEEAIQDACAETVAEQQGLNSNGDIDDDADTVDVEA